MTKKELIRTQDNMIAALLRELSSNQENTEKLVEYTEKQKSHYEELLKAERLIAKNLEGEARSIQSKIAMHEKYREQMYPGLKRLNSLCKRNNLVAPESSLTAWAAAEIRALRRRRPKNVS